MRTWLSVAVVILLLSVAGCSSPPATRPAVSKSPAPSRATSAALVAGDSFTTDSGLVGIVPPGWAGSRDTATGTPRHITVLQLAQLSDGSRSPYGPVAIISGESTSDVSAGVLKRALVSTDVVVYELLDHGRSTVTNPRRYVFATSIPGEQPGLIFTGFVSDRPSVAVRHVWELLGISSARLPAQWR